jgi:hypothetical protein
MINNEITEFEFKSTGNKNHDSTDVGSVPPATTRG